MALNNVVIIGGGVAGLCAAIHCERRGLDWTLLEASDRLGGRVGSRMIDGCRIDRGFAVLLTAYPELRGMIDLEQLDLRTFQSGARIRRGGAFIRVANPLRHPIRGVISALTGAIGMIDVFRILPIALCAAFGRSVIDPDASHGFSARDLLRQVKVSEQLIGRFFRPFFGGIFLDGSLGADAAAFEFRLAMFARGAAALPREGMGAIAQQLIAQIPNERIRMATAVREINRIGEDATATRWCITTNVCRRCSIAAPISSIARLVFDRSDHLASRSRKASFSTSRTHLASRWRWRWTSQSSVLSNISRRCICATWDEPDQRQCDRSSRSQTQRRRTRAFCTRANGEMVFSRSNTRMETPLHRPNWPRSPTPTSAGFRSAAEDGSRRRTISCWRSRDRWFD
ncbi:MAG: FAD-dependent oxidoreductase [Planctomycetota bacterium]|nr:FAD-dependent oxidoreductase [Planctomycetota bacterium]